MENFSYHVPFYVVTGGVATSGHSSELHSGQVGLFDRSTFSVATGIGSGKEFFFAQGNTGGKDWYGQPVTETHKSPFFFGKDISNMYKSLHQTIQNEEWVIGYNGGPSSKSLKFEKGVPIRVKLYFHGQPIYRFFGGPKEYVISYTPTEDCTEPCNADDCPDAIVDCLTHTQALVDQINTHTELKKFGVTASLVNNPFTAATPNMTKYCLSLCDNGDVFALQAVQAQAPIGVTVTRIARSGSTSTYEFCQRAEAEGPAAFAQTGSVLEAVCDECPSGSFLIEAKDVFIIRRPIVGGEDFSTASTRDTYANTVWTNYADQESVTTTTSTTAAPTTTSTTSTTTSGSTTTTTSHGTTTTTTTGAPLTNSDATFVGSDGAVAIVKVKFPQGTVLDPAIGTDSIEFSHTEPAVCVFDDPAIVYWSACGTGISSVRTMKIKCLNRPDCDASSDRLDDLRSILAGVQGIDLNSLTKIAGDACCDDYTVGQASIDCYSEDDCQTNNVTFHYDDLPAFENSSWEVVPETVVDNADRKCGIRITAGYIDPQYGNCSFVPTDYYETMPLKMEVSLLGEDDSACDAAQWPSVQQTRVGRIARQSGEYVVREVLMKTAAYLKHVSQFSIDSRDREAFDMRLLDSVDRKAFYDLYYVSFKASYGNSFRKNEQEKFTTVFAFKAGDASSINFENSILDVLTAKSGVSMHLND